MNWIDSIKEIRKAQQNNRLVIFVGAGVSQNSGLPSWEELIKKIAIEINYYEKCKTCSEKNAKCAKTRCEKCFEYSQDEFLRIPEYFYQKNKTGNHKKYYDFLSKALTSSMESNSINNEIMNILPHHIITTNYDALLEDSSNINTTFYDVIINDSDLLAKANDRYIIKMHGDLKDPKTIILKESDYINYEQQHILISTFIKALLTNHTFLFLGYGLNDYNLNLIIGWINFFSDIHKIEKRPRNFLVQDKKASKFEQKRLTNRNINVVALDEIPKEVEDRIGIPKDLTDGIGRKLFLYLKCITKPGLLDEYSSLKDILNEKYKKLESYTRISYNDFKNVYCFGRMELKASSLILYDEEWYDKIVPLITKENEIIVKTFAKTGITNLVNYSNGTKLDLPSILYDEDELFKIYVNNDYQTLFLKLEDSKSSREILYYNNLLNINHEMKEILLEQDKKTINKEDYAALLLHKTIDRISTLSWGNEEEAKTEEIRLLINTIPQGYQKTVKFLNDMFFTFGVYHNEMQSLLIKQEEKFIYKQTTSYSEHSFEKIWSLQAYAYDLYYFFKYNYIPLDYFGDARNYFSYYLNAILCSYYPLSSRKNISIFPTDRRPFKLGEIEIDMYIKYMDAKNFDASVKKYLVKELYFEEGICIKEKFYYFCRNFLKFWHDEWSNQLLNFVKLIGLFNLGTKIQEEIYFEWVNFLFKIKENERLGIFERIIDSIQWVERYIRGKSKDKSRMANLLCEKACNNNVLRRNEINDLLRRLNKHISEDDVKRFKVSVEEVTDPKQRCHKIMTYLGIMDLNCYAEYLYNNIKCLSYTNVYLLLLKGVFNFDENIEQYLLTYISDCAQNKSNTPGLLQFPDPLDQAVEQYVILFLKGKISTLSKIEVYKKYSDYLEFLVKPEGFDYRKVNLENYIWQYIVYSEKYKNIMLSHRNDILTKELEEAFRKGASNMEEQKIVYGLLLNDDELKNYGKD